MGQSLLLHWKTVIRQKVALQFLGHEDLRVETLYSPINGLLGSRSGSVPTFLYSQIKGFAHFLNNITAMKHDLLVPGQFQREGHDLMGERVFD